MFLDPAIAPAVNDSLVHEWTLGCWCRPFATEIPDEVPALTLVVHRSFAGGPVLESMPGVVVSHVQRAEDEPSW